MAANPARRRFIGPSWCALALLALAAAVRAFAAAPAVVKLASWNLEWFMTPNMFNSLKGGCTHDDQAHRARPRSIPCDVAAKLERSATDIAALASIARTLDADVIAVQEVDGQAAARQIFPRHEFCFTGGLAVQNTGFAIRRGLPFRCGPDLTELALGGDLRRGVTMVLYPGTRHELHLLGVHLKSGCTRHDLDSHEKACARLARQVPALHDWLASEQQLGHRYAVLGDFNRDLLAETGEGLWAQLSLGAPGLELVNTARGAEFRNCYAGQTHTGFIDYILLSASLERSLMRGSFQRLAYSAADAWRLKLSDHCPVAIRLRLD